jgi:ceramide glucosyltransferase
MTPLILASGAICATLALVHLASILVAIARVRSSPDSRSLADHCDGVSIIRPVCGIENFTEETLGSALVLDYPDYEVVFCVARSTDPVVPVVRRLIASHPDVPARLLVGNDGIGPNPKLNNMVKGWAAARHDWIVMADSNVLMPRDYLQRLFAVWQSGTGLVCSPAVGCLPDGLWAELECGFLNTYQARWQHTADAFGLGFAQGKTMLWRRDLLERSGGIRALAAEVAEDAAATKLIRRLGLRVRLVAAPFPQPLGARSFADVWRRQVRWARLRRDTFKAFFIPEILAGALVPFAACAICAAAAEWPVANVAAGFLATWYGTEAMLAYAAGWQLSVRSPIAWVLRDLLLPVLWIASWTGNDFVWRGNVMHVADRSSSA